MQSTEQRFFKLDEQTINSIIENLENIEIAKGTHNAIRLISIYQLIQKAQPLEIQKTEWEGEI